MNTLTSLLFRPGFATLYRRSLVDASRSLPALIVHPEELPEEHQARWLRVNEALQAQLAPGEDIGDIVVERTGRVPAAYVTETQEDPDREGYTVEVEVPSSWRESLACNLTIRCLDGSQRQLFLPTEQLSDPAVRDALLDLWTYLSSLP